RQRELSGCLSRRAAGSFPRTARRDCRRHARRFRRFSCRYGACQARRTLHAEGGRGRAESERRLAAARRGQAMIAELGHFALVLAFALAALQAGLSLWGAARRDFVLMRVAAPMALAGLGFVAFAFAALVTAYVQSDFSVAIVYANSHSAQPLLYKVTG